MRYWIVSLFVIVTSLTSAQHRPLTYGVDDLPQSLLQNPGAAINFSKHIGAPLLSGISIDAGANAITAFDIFKTESDINSNIENAINRLRSTDYFSGNVQVEWLSFGWSSKRRAERYYSAGAYVEADFIGYFPKDLAILAYNGNAGAIERPFNLGHISGRTSVVNTYHFGIQEVISPKWIVGARAKLYSSIFNATSTSNQGTFITRNTFEGPNFYSHDIENADLRLDTSGIDGLDQEINPVATVIKRGLFSGNIGLGLDLGATFMMDDHWSFSASLIDIGFIQHAKNVRSATAKGTYGLEGIELVFPEIINGTETNPYYDDLVDEIEEQLNYNKNVRESYTTLRPLKINAGANYGFGQGFLDDCACRKGNRRYENNIGAQLFAVKRPQHLQTAATVYFDRRWTPNIRTKLTYGVDEFSYTNVGLLVSFNVHKINLYLASNNVLSFANLAKANSASLQLGLQWVAPPNPYR